MVDAFEENLAALEVMNFPVAQWDFVRTMMLIRRLDEETKLRFELVKPSTTVPNYKSLINFLTEQYLAYDNVNLTQLNHRLVLLISNQ